MSGIKEHAINVLPRKEDSRLGEDTRNGDLTDSRKVMEAHSLQRVSNLPNGSPSLAFSPPPRWKYKSLTMRIMGSRFASANFWDMDGL